MSLLFGSGSDEDCVNHEATAKIDYSSPDSFGCIEEKLLVYLHRLYLDGIRIKELFLTQSIYDELNRSLGSKFNGVLYILGREVVIKVDNT